MSKHFFTGCLPLVTSLFTFSGYSDLEPVQREDTAGEGQFLSEKAGAATVFNKEIQLGQCNAGSTGFSKFNE
jgi:hypothetical protein